MGKNINVNITDGEYSKIKASGLTISEYTRRAIDAYDVDLDTIRNEAKIEIVTEINKILYIQLENLKNIKKNEDFKENKASKIKNNFKKPVVKTGNIKNIFINKDSKIKESLYNEDKIFNNLYNNTKKIKKESNIENDPVTDKLGNYVYTLAKMRKTSENGVKLSDEALKHIALESDISVSVLKSYWSRHKKELLALGNMQQH